MHAVTGAGRLIAGRYRLAEPIGRGAMGIVWRGRDELLARDVAVKEVQITAQALPANAEQIYQRTLREARAAAGLQHPAVVTVYDVVEENGSPWIVMELIEARSLDTVVAEDGPLPPLAAAALGTSLVGALAAAHAAGVLHRDVKPANVLVTSDGRAVLTDFGIAKFAADPSATLTGLVSGTPGYTAPERLHGSPASPASDLWSLGATLFAAVEGRGPFDRDGSALAITAAVATEDPPRATSAGPLAAVIDALLSKDPADRPDAAATEQLLAAASSAGRSDSQPAPGAADASDADDAASTDPASPGTGAATGATPGIAAGIAAAVATEAATGATPGIAAAADSTGAALGETPGAAALPAAAGAAPAASLGSGNGPVYWQPVKPPARRRRARILARRPSRAGRRSRAGQADLLPLGAAC